MFSKLSQQSNRQGSRRRSGAHTRAFTLIEVLVVVAIVAILAALAGPSFVKTTQRFRSLSEINGFAGDLQFARSEAIKQGQSVTLCASSNGATCLATSNWHTGWIIFSDPAATQVMCNGCKLRVQSSWLGTDTFIASGTTPAITFSRDGFRMTPASSAGAILFTLHTTPVNTNATQCVSVTQTGRQSTLAYGTSGCT